MKLNIGCGADYREGFINIDGRDDLGKVDKVINLSEESLLDYFKEGDADYILANDFIEHHFHWQAVELLKCFHALLKPGGVLEMRLPDFEFIISSKEMAPEPKITLLFGGQDFPQGEADPTSRKRFPEFFCHKYSYTKATMKRELEKVGFLAIRTEQEGTNFLIKSVKP